MDENGFLSTVEPVSAVPNRKLEKSEQEHHGRVPMTISVFASRLYDTFHLIADHILSADTNCLAHVRFLGRFWQLSAFLRLGLVLI